MSLSRLESFEERQERRRRIRKIPHRRLRDRENPLEELNSDEFKRRFHIYKQTAVFIVDMIKKDLQSCNVKRGIHLPPILKFLIAMRFFATGSFQLSVGDLHTVNQSTVSNLILKVSKAIAFQQSKFIQFPKKQEAREVHESFFRIGQFPGVVGVIDGCHINIGSPGGENAELFRNRKGYMSINVQGVCDASMNFTNIVARWYGSAHDARIFENSALYCELEDGSFPKYLLGDSAYPLKSFILTPLEHPITIPQKRYQKAFLKTRNLIERCFGIWKRRFPCLNRMRLKLKTTLVVIVATTVLHNISRARNDLYLEDYYELNTTNDNEICTEASMGGKAVQNNLIASHFQ